MQVVELPREDPDAPLRLFAGIPGLRILVVGGDGTVGCVPFCLLAFGAPEPRKVHWQTVYIGGRNDSKFLCRIGCVLQKAAL